MISGELITVFHSFYAIDFYVFLSILLFFKQLGYINPLAHGLPKNHCLESVRVGSGRVVPPIVLESNGR